MGYMLCDGSLLSRSVYPSLFQVVGTSFNIGSPSENATNFRIPDMRGKSTLGANKDLYRFTSHRAVGTYGGAETHALVAGELAGHQHSATTSIQNATHNHTTSLATASNTTAGFGLDSHYHNYSATGLTANDGDDTGGKTCPEDQRNGADVARQSSTSRVGGINNTLNHGHSYSVTGPTVQHSHTFTTNDGSLSGIAHNNIQPCVVAGFYIKY